MRAKVKRPGLRWPFLLMPMMMACSAQTIPTTQETPALLLEPGAAPRIEIRASLARMLGTPDVTVADDVLLQESILMIDKARGRDGRGRPLSGRDLGKPAQFRLVITGQTCALVNLQTDERAYLTATSCKPVQ